MNKLLYWYTILRQLFNAMLIICVFERVCNCVVLVDGSGGHRKKSRRKPHNNHDILFNNGRHFQIIPGSCVPHEFYQSKI